MTICLYKERCQRCDWQSSTKMQEALLSYCLHYTVFNICSLTVHFINFYIIKCLFTGAQNVQHFQGRFSVNCSNCAACFKSLSNKLSLQIRHDLFVRWRRSHIHHASMFSCAVLVHSWLPLVTIWLISHNSQWRLIYK